MSTRVLPMLSSLTIAVATIAAPLTAIATTHTMIVTSDPQYPWKDETPGSPKAGSAGELAARATEMITEQYESIAAFRHARPGEEIPVFINGDLTAYGHGWQRTEMERLYGILGGNVHLGLGNHDYDNNVDNCYNNGCARDSVLGYAAHVRGKERLSFDFETHPGAFVDRYTGSLAYAFLAPGMGRVLNVQLNNSPNYAVSFASAGSTFELTSPLPWLRYTLDNYLTVPTYGTPEDRVADFAIVHMHQPYAVGKREQVEVDQKAFDDIVGKHDVAAIFAGHLHGRLGRYWGEATPVPIFLSGSASTRSYLIVEHDDVEKVLRVFGVRNNDPERKYLIETVPAGHVERD